MKTLDELFKEFDGMTSLQRDERVKKLVGAEVQIVGELGTIASDYISCRNFKPAVSSINSISIEHQGEELRKQLLEYASEDGVRMNTRFTGVRFGESDHYTFALVSIVRLYTREMKMEEEDEANLRKARLSGIWGILAGALSGFVTGIGLCIALAVVILPIYDWRKYGLGSPKNDSPWPQVVMAVATIGGAVLGYNDFFRSERLRRGR